MTKSQMVLSRMRRQKNASGEMQLQKYMPQ
jgi:hypothetical protein